MISIFFKSYKGIPVQAFPFPADLHIKSAGNEEISCNLNYSMPHL